MTTEMKYLSVKESIWSLNLHSMRFEPVDSRCSYPATRQWRTTELCMSIETFFRSVLSIPVRRSHKVCHMKL